MNKEFLNNYDTEWDAREYFVKELMYRIHLVLSSDFKDPHEWFERLQDYYDFSSCCLSDGKYEKEIDEIDKLLYSKHPTNRETKERKVKAYEKMRQLFRDIQKDLLKQGILMPITERGDPGQALKRFKV